MTITFIDYTPFYFMLIAKTGIPPVTRGKFVQMRHATALYLVFSPAEFTKYHAHIVERFCMDKGVEGAYDQNGTKFILADRAWDILGGGKFERDEKNKVIKLFDDSMAYGKFDAMTLREMTAALPDLAGYTIDIE